MERGFAVFMERGFAVFMERGFAVDDEPGSSSSENALAATLKRSIEAFCASDALAVSDFFEQNVRLATQLDDQSFRPSV